MKKSGFVLIIILFAIQFSLAQSRFATWTPTELQRTTVKVLRTIQLPGTAGHFLTTVYKPVDGDFYYFKKNSTDFQFEVNNIVYSGRTPWKLIKIESLADSKSGDGAAVTLLSSNNKIQLTIHRSEEHTSELQSHSDIVCRRLLGDKKKAATSA